ncbi:MAG: hypothetical protein RSE10_06540, partial [Oscillospiraceae bacterium]
GELDEKANKAAAIFISNVSQDKAEKLKQALRADGKKHSADDVLQIATEVSSPMLANAIRNYL